MDFVFRDLLFIVFYMPLLISINSFHWVRIYFVCVCVCGCGFKTLLCSFTMNLFSVALFKLTKIYYVLNSNARRISRWNIGILSYRTQMEVHSSGLCDSLFGCVHISTESICTRKTLMRYRKTENHLLFIQFKSNHCWGFDERSTVLFYK